MTPPGPSVGIDEALGKGSEEAGTPLYHRLTY